MSIQSISSVPMPVPQATPAATAALSGPGTSSAAPDAASTPAAAAAPSVARPGQTNAGSGQTQRQPVADLAEVRQALDEVREALAPVAQNLQFSIDEDTGTTVIKIIDSSTDEVIKQIPPEEILAVAKAIDKLQGLLIRQEA